MKRKIPVELNSLQQTLLITLGGRADESRLADSLLQDHFAAEAKEQIDFDFSKIRLSHDGLVALAVRAHTLDDWIRDFLVAHESPTVIHLGCGLDSRIFRIDPPPEVCWWEVDFPEVIRLRRSLFPEREGCHFLEASILQPGWLDAIESTGPVVVVAEGILAYFAPREVTQVLNDLVRKFPAGEVLFDAYNRWGISYLNRLPSLRLGDARLKFALNDPRSLETSVPGLKLIEEHNGAPQQQIRRASAWMRYGYRLSQKIASLRRMGQLLRYGFGSAGEPPGELGNIFTK